jgi:hypothetical protein
MDVGFTAHNALNVAIIILIMILFFREVGKW